MIWREVCLLGQVERRGEAADQFGLYRLWRRAREDREFEVGMHPGGQCPIRGGCEPPGVRGIGLGDQHRLQGQIVHQQDRQAFARGVIGRAGIEVASATQPGLIGSQSDIEQAALTRRDALQLRAVPQEQGIDAVIGWQGELIAWFSIPRVD